MEDIGKQIKLDVAEFPEKILITISKGYNLLNDVTIGVYVFSKDRTSPEKDNSLKV